MNMQRYWVVMVLLVAITACGGGHQTSSKVVIENPYVQRVKDMTHLGVVAMQKERWASAENAFNHALQASKLANNPILIVHANYNLAMVHKAMWQASEMNITQVQDELSQVIRIGKKHHMDNEVIGAQLQLQLLQVKAGLKPNTMPILPDGLSESVYLTAARLAQLQGKPAQAGQLYHKTLTLAKNNRSGLLLQAQARMGLGLLAKDSGDETAAQKEIKKVLAICLQVGAPRISANASMLLSGLNNLSKQERIDYAERAMSIYQLLHDEHGEAKAKAVLTSLHG